MPSRKPALVVADTGPLIVLGVVDLLKPAATVLGPLAVPEAVLGECLQSPQSPGAPQVAQALQSGHLRPVPDVDLRALDPAHVLGLGAGESAVIAYARQHACVALVDDRKARATATRLAVPVIGSGAVLLALKQAGHLASLQPVLDAWAAHGYFMSPALRYELLRKAREVDSTSP